MIYWIALGGALAFMFWGVSLYVLVGFFRESREYDRDHMGLEFDDYACRDLIREQNVKRQGASVVQSTTGTVTGVKPAPPA